MKTLQELTRPNIWKLKPYSSARDEYKGAVASVFLDANENPYNLPHNRYPDPMQWELKTLLSKIKKVSPQHIFLGNGSDEAIDLVFRAFCEPEKDIVAHVNEVGRYLYEKLEEVKNQFAAVKDHRGVGLMQGLEFEGPVGDLIVTALKKGLVIISAGANIIRFVPPLVIEKKDVDEMIAILTEAMKENGLQ